MRCSGKKICVVTVVFLTHGSGYDARELIRQRYALGMRFVGNC